MKNRKSQTVAILTFIIAGIIIALFIAGFRYMMNRFTTILLSVPSTNVVNITSAVQGVVVPINNSMYLLNAISVAILIGLIIGMFVEAYFVRKHPILFVVHFFVVAISVTASIYISNAYFNLMQNPLLGTLISGNKGMSFIQLNLPIIVSIIGFLSLILLFIGINRDSEQRSGL